MQTSQVIDVERARHETPGCTNVVHFNNAGAALMPDRVLRALEEYQQLEAEIGGYEAAETNSAKLAGFYDNAAALLNCRSDEVAFIENATRAWDMAFYSLNFQAGDTIITANSEYASNYIAFLQIARKTGAKIEVIPNDEYGQVCLKTLKQRINKNTKLIAITHVPTNGGLVNPAEEIGKIAKETGITYLLDACQSVGQMPIDVKALGCDILSCTGRKYLRGPRGTGILYIDKALALSVEPIFLDLHAADWIDKDNYVVRDDARRFETWESNYAGKIALAEAMNYAQAWGLQNIEARVTYLATLLRNKLSEVNGIEVHDLGKRKCGIVSFSIADVHHDAIRYGLHRFRINVSTSTPRGTRIDMEARKLAGVVRASVHYYNTEEEVSLLVDTLARMVQAGQ